MDNNGGGQPVADELSKAQREQVVAIVDQAIDARINTLTDEIVRRVSLELSKNRPQGESRSSVVSRESSSGDNYRAQFEAEWIQYRAGLEAQGISKSAYFATRARDLGVETPVAHPEDNATQSQLRREYRSKPHLHAMGISEDAYVAQQCG